jgi:hypothetical protein
MKLFAIFKNEEFLGSIKSMNGQSLKNWAADFYKCPIAQIVVYEMVEVK